MKKLYAFLPLLALPVIMILLASSSGSPGGFSGSPGDNGMNCTSCHSGTAQTASGWISTNVTGAGYVGGETYTITVNGSHAGSSKFGFEMTAEDASGTKVGTFIITNAGETKLANSNKSVTHTFAGTSGQGGSKTWSADWTAPPGSTGPITFYASVNATNSNGGTSGDVVYLTNIAITPDVTNVEEYSRGVSFYPNPANGLINFDATSLEAETEITISNVNGRHVHRFTAVSGIMQVDLSHLSAGVYFVKIATDINAETQKLIIR
jgi:hypothetical protein